MVNRGGPTADAFCGSGGTELTVKAGEKAEPTPKLYDLEGNQGMCSRNALPPGERTTNTLMFRVPAGDEAPRLDLWNGDEPGDILGNTRIAIRL